MAAKDKLLRTADDLVAAGLAPPDRRQALRQVAERYSVAITPVLAAAIDRRDQADPIARQFVPDRRELAPLPNENPDPIGDDAHSPVPGVVHRYPDRVLLKVTHVCAAYCRFCFRRETVGPGHSRTLNADALEAAFGYIAAHPEIFEVILTGGDPLVVSARRLKALVERLGALTHVSVVRVHTRVPVSAPERVTAALVRALRLRGKATYVVLHANHARELTPAAKAACARFIDAGIPMLSQTVLLKGVNDDPQTLADLMRALVANRIKPYYLHHLDLAPGTSHFRVSIAKGQDLMRALHGRHSGLCQPTYVLDIPGGQGKSPIGPSYHTPQADGSHLVRDFNGGEHCYPPVARQTR